MLEVLLLKIFLIIAYGIPCKKKDNINFHLEKLIIELNEKMKKENVNLCYEYNISDIDKEEKEKILLKNILNKQVKNID